MAVSTSSSFLLSFTLIILITASMQLYKNTLASSEIMTILGGFLGNVLFIFILTAIGNLEKMMFGAGFQTKVFPEIIFALLASVFASALVHRVSASTCVIFSLISLYYINRVSQSFYSVPVTATPLSIKKKK